MRSGVARFAVIVFLMCFLIASEATPQVVDGHNHDAVSAAGGEIDFSGLEVLSSRGVDAVIVPLPLDRSETSDLEGRIGSELPRLRSAVSAVGEISLADHDHATPGVEQGVGITVFFAIEWFGSLFDGDPTKVGRFRELGVRVISLTEGDPDGLFGGGDRTGLLTPFGRQIVSAMNEAGVLIDITHLDQHQMLEVIQRSKTPVVATHSLARQVSESRHNLSTEVVSALANSGGSVWMSFNRAELIGSGTEETAIATLIDHVDFLIDHLGAGNVGIGSDLQAGGKYVPEPLNRTDAFRLIRSGLLERGHTPAVVDGVLGHNILRALGVELE